MDFRKIFVVTLSVAMTWGPVAMDARADDAAVADFYKGKQLKIISGFSPGATSYAYAQLLTRHMGRYIPGNPSLIIQIMLGAGTLRAYQYIFNAAPRDGTEIGSGQRSALVLPLFDEAAKFDGSKFSYIGSTNRESLLLIAWKNTGVRTLDDLRRKPLIVGTTGRGALVANVAAALENTIGVKFKVVSGYADTNDINIALERNEVQGRFLSASSVDLIDWRKQGKIMTLLQMGLQKRKELPEVPLIYDILSSKLDKQAIKLIFATDDMGRPFVGPPELPEERLAALRAAFDETMRDKDFQEEAARMKLEINPMTSKEMEELISELYSSPEPVIERARKIQTRQ